MVVILPNVFFDLSHKFFYTSESATSYRSLGDEVEPDFNLVEPRGIGRCVMDVPSFMNCQPAPDLGMFVSGIVVDYQVNG